MFVWLDCKTTKENKKGGINQPKYSRQTFNLIVYFAASDYSVATRIYNHRVTFYHFKTKTSSAGRATLEDTSSARLITELIRGLRISEGTPHISI